MEWAHSWFQGIGTLLGPGTGVGRGRTRQNFGTGDHAHLEVRNHPGIRAEGDGNVIRRYTEADGSDGASGREMTLFFVQVDLVPSAVC